MSEKIIDQRENHFSNSFSDAIGKTPLMKVNSLSVYTGCLILAKAEWMNPGGSVKDRAALSMIDRAEQEGKLTPGRGQTIVEATAGNTGIALLHIASERGYKCLFTVPASVSQEKIAALKARGAQVEVCPLVPGTDERHFQNRAKQISEEQGAFWVCQFENLSNAEGHYKTTGPEIWEQTNKKISAFCTASGTGGTMAGISQFLKEQSPDIKCFLIDPPQTSVTVDLKASKPRDRTPEEKEAHIQLLAKFGSKKATMMEGIGPGKLYGNLGTASVDGMFYVTDEAAIQIAKFVQKHDGLFVGGSAAVNLLGSALCAKMLGPGHTVVTIIGDSGEKYMTKMYSEEFLKQTFEEDSFVFENPTLDEIINPMIQLNQHIFTK